MGGSLLSQWDIQMNFNVLSLCSTFSSHRSSSCIDTMMRKVTTCRASPAHLTGKQGKAPKWVCLCWFAWAGSGMVSSRFGIGCGRWTYCAFMLQWGFQINTQSYRLERDTTWAWGGNWEGNKRTRQRKIGGGNFDFFGGGGVGLGVGGR